MDKEMIPEIRIKTTFPFCRAYASSPVATEPSYDRGLKEAYGWVSLEYAAFLINQGELEIEDYVDAVGENYKESEFLKGAFESFETAWGHESACKLLRSGIRTQVEKAIKNDNTKWMDWE